MFVAFPAESLPNYGICCLQRGPFLVADGEQLLQEGMGFGVPVVKKRGLAFFPGSGNVELLTGNMARITFEMNRVLQMKSPLSLASASLTHFSVMLDVAYRRVKIMRNRTLLKMGKILRDWLRVKEVFQETKTLGEVLVAYRLSEGLLRVAADFSRLDGGLAEYCLLNEQGGDYFCRYEDDAGLELRGNEIGGWERVSAEQAILLCDEKGVAFGLKNKAGANLYRGRLLLADELNWAGLDYQFSPRETFFYEIEIRGAECDRCGVALPLFQTQV
jgi:hypothetical protein